MNPRMRPGFDDFEIQIERGSTANCNIQFNEQDDQWHVVPVEWEQDLPDMIMETDAECLLAMSIAQQQREERDANVI